MPEDRQGFDIEQDPRYWRAGGVIWLVAGAAFLALGVSSYGGPWLIALGITLMTGGGLMFTRHFSLARFLFYPIVGVGLAHILITDGWGGVLRIVVLTAFIVLWFLVKWLRRKLSAQTGN